MAQYGLMRTKIETLPWLLADAAEAALLDDRVCPEVPPSFGDGAVLKISYGAMLWSPSTPGRNPDDYAADLEKARTGIEECLGLAFRGMEGRTEFRMVLEDIRFYPTHVWSVRRVPIVALIRTAEEIPDSHYQGLTVFPAYRDMDYLKNLINRPAVLCLKGEERRARDAVNADKSDWDKHIKPGRVVLTASKCI